MFDPAPRWLKAVALLTAAAFIVDVIVIYAVRFAPWLESDATVPVLLGARSLHSGLPFARDWYYGNGDVWVAAPHLLAILPVAFLGIGYASLWISTVVGFALELIVLARAYAQLAGSRAAGWLAAAVTLVAWSRFHIRFVYIQLAYGFGAVLYALVFAAFAARIVAPSPTWRRQLGLALLVLLAAVQNPTRGLVFVLVPLLASSAWPWRSISMRHRARVAISASLGWLIAAAIYRFVLTPLVSFAYPPGHIDFILVDGWAGVALNAHRLWAGLQALCGTSRLSWLTLPACFLLTTSLILVVREVVRSREPTALRVVCVAVLAQLGVVVLPLLVGNLMIAPTSVRYLMPSLLIALGLGAIIAIRDAREAATRWRRLAVVWLIALPVAVALAIPKSRPPTARAYQWADPRGLPALGAELARRDLTHGFATLLNTNLLNFGARGGSMICPVYLTPEILPQRWLADTRCFVAAALPERFFVVTERGTDDSTTLRSSLPPPEEQFRFGATFEVAIYRTSAVPLTWLELPIHDGDELVLPLRIQASHPALHRGKATRDAGRLIATGEPGPIAFGPGLRLPRGTYRVIWRGAAMASPGRLRFAVTADDGDVLASEVIDSMASPPGSPTRVELSFSTDRPRGGVELEVVSGGGARIALEEVVLERR